MLQGTSKGMRSKLSTPKAKYAPRSARCAGRIAQPSPQGTTHGSRFNPNGTAPPDASSETRASPIPTAQRRTRALEKPLFAAPHCV